MEKGAFEVTYFRTHLFLIFMDTKRNFLFSKLDTEHRHAASIASGVQVGRVKDRDKKRRENNMKLG